MFIAEDLSGFTLWLSVCPHSNTRRVPEYSCTIAFYSHQSNNSIIWLWLNFFWMFYLINNKSLDGLSGWQVCLDVVVLLFHLLVRGLDKHLKMDMYIHVENTGTHTHTDCKTCTHYCYFHYWWTWCFNRKRKKWKCTTVVALIWEPCFIIKNKAFSNLVWGLIIHSQSLSAPLLNHQSLIHLSTHPSCHHPGQLPPPETLLPHS